MELNLLIVTVLLAVLIGLVAINIRGARAHHVLARLAGLSMIATAIIATFLSF